MNILIADALSPSAVSLLQAAGHAVTMEPALKGEALVEQLKNLAPRVLVVRSTKVPSEALDASPALELVVRAGAGYDNIDFTGAAQRGIFVANCPGKNARAVAELTIGLILSMDRRIPDNVADARAGQWNKKKYSKSAGVSGRTLGLVGLGNIGTHTARMAIGLGMNVVGWSRSLTAERAKELGIRQMASARDVAAEADVVSLHLASNAETRHLANRAFFEAMKPGAFFINTSRAELVDEEALLWAIEQKELRAALDVFEGEPASKEGSFDAPLASRPEIYITHHIGASTQQAQEAIASEAARVINIYGETGTVPNCVNLAASTPATHLLTVRHRDRVGVLAAVLDEVKKAEWNVQEMENLIFEGAEAACARIRFDGVNKPDVAEQIQALENVLAVSVHAL